MKTVLEYKGERLELEFPPLCKNCLHYEWRRGGVIKPDGYDYCDVDKKRSPVDGKPLYRSAENMRLAGQRCGPDGKLWEQTP